MVYGIYQSPNKSITCLVNQTKEVFIIQIIGRIHFKYYKEAFEVTLEAQEMHPYTQMIVNFRDVKLSPDNLRFWFVFNFIKNFYKTNKELKIAIVYGNRLWDKRFIRFWLKLRAIFGSKVAYEFFEEIQPAENWIEGIEETEDNFTFVDNNEESEVSILKSWDKPDKTFYSIEEEDEVEDMFDKLDKGEIGESEELEETNKEKKSFWGFLKKEKKKNESKKERKPIKVQIPKVKIKILKNKKTE